MKYVGIQNLVTPIIKSSNKPTLLLDFENSKKLSSIVSFSRSSIATYFDESGVLVEASADTPRFDHNPATYESRGILIEESRTNLLIYSNNFEKWTTSNANVIQNCIISPDGKYYGYKLVDTSTSISHNIYEGGMNFTSGQIYTYSIFAKASERTYLYINLSTSSFTNINATFNLTTGVVTSTSGSTIARISDIGNGWYKCSITGTATTTGTGVQSGSIAISNGSTTVFAGDNKSGLYIYGAQIEAGSFPTSYIPSSETFTSRASTATYLDSNNILQTAAINILRNSRIQDLVQNSFDIYEPSATNLLKFSENFDQTANWAISNCNLISNRTTAPDYTFTGTKLIENTATNNHYVYQYVTLTSSTVYTFSVFLKYSDYALIKIVFTNKDGTMYHANIDLGAMTIVPDTNYGIAYDCRLYQINGSTNWYRVSITAPSGTGATQSSVSIYLIKTGFSTNYAGDGSSGIYIWGAQLETGYTATSYIPSSESFTSRSSTATYINSNGNIASVSSNTSRTQFNPDYLSYSSPLYENSATNLILQSENITTSWAADITVISTSNVATAPDGTSTADKIVATTSNSEHTKYQAISGITTSLYTFSVFVKKAELTYCIVRMSNSATNNDYAQAHVNLSTGSIIGTNSAGAFTNPISTIITLGNSWYRIGITALITGITNINVKVDISDGVIDSLTDGLSIFVGDGTSGIYMWGAQLETGTSMTSYIPTTTSTVTRSADVISSSTTTRANDYAVIEENEFMKFFNFNGGTFITNYTHGYDTDGCYIISCSDGTSSNRYDVVAHNSGDTLRNSIAVNTNSTLNSPNTSSTLASNTYYQLTSKYNSTTVGVSANDGVVRTHSLSGISDHLNQMAIGSTYGTTSFLNGWISKISYSPIVETDQQLAIISKI